MLTYLIQTKTNKAKNETGVGFPLLMIALFCAKIYAWDTDHMRAICKFYNPCKNNIIQHQNICYKIQTQCFCFAFTSFLAFFFMCVFTLKEEYMCVPLISILILLVDKSITIGFFIELIFKFQTTADIDLLRNSLANESKICGDWILCKPWLNRSSLKSTFFMCKPFFIR